MHTQPRIYQLLLASAALLGAQAFGPVVRSCEVSLRTTRRNEVVALARDPSTRLYAEQFMATGLLEGEAVSMAASRVATHDDTSMRSSRWQAPRGLDSVLTQIASSDTLPRPASSFVERSRSVAEAEKEVLRVTRRWLNTVTSGKATAPAETARLYAKDAVLWGTVSEQLRVNPTEIEDYFDLFAKLPQLQVKRYQPFVRVFGDVAINDGYYDFSFKNAEGKEVEKKARFSFVFRRTPSNDWEIIDHHSSLVPTAPQGLKPATTVVL